MDLVHLISFQALFIFCHLVNECAFSIFSLVKVTWAVMNREPTLEASFKTFLLCVCVHLAVPTNTNCIKMHFQSNLCGTALPKKQQREIKTDYFSINDKNVKIFGNLVGSVPSSRNIYCKFKYIFQKGKLSFSYLMRHGWGNFSNYDGFNNFFHISFYE